MKLTAWDYNLVPAEVQAIVFKKSAAVQKNRGTLFKNTILKPSGVLVGPITLVYGVGGLSLLLINKYILNKIHTNKIIKLIISFILYTIAFTLVEFTCGHLCHLIFGIDMWNYTSKKYNIGKYICLEYMPIWGLYGLTITYILKPFLDKIIKQIPREVTYLFIILLSLDLIITILTK